MSARSVGHILCLNVTSHHMPNVLTVYFTHYHFYTSVVFPLTNTEVTCVMSRSIRSPVWLKQLWNELPRLFSQLGMSAWPSGMRWTAFQLYDMTSKMSTISPVHSKRLWNEFPRLFSCLGISAWPSGVRWTAFCLYEMALEMSARSPVCLKQLWNEIPRPFNQLGMSAWPSGVRWIAFCQYDMALEMSPRLPVHSISKIIQLVASGHICMALRSEIPVNCFLLIWYYGIRNVSKIPSVFETTLVWNSKIIQLAVHVCMVLRSEMKCFLLI